MYSVFLLSYFLLLFIFLFKKRDFDFISIYVITLFAYNSITLFGLSFNPIERLYVDVNPEVFITTSIVFFTAIPFIFLPSLTHKKNSLCPQKKEESSSNIFLLIILALSIYGAMYSFPKLLAAQNKTEALELSSNASLILTQTLPIAGLLIALINKKKIPMLIFFVILFTVFLLGSRRPLVLALLAIFIIKNQSSTLRLILNYKLIFIGILLLVFIVLGKTLYGSLMREGLNGIDLWLKNFSYKYFIIGGEAMNMTTILDAVITNNFPTDSTDIAKSLLAITPIPLEYFNFSSNNFNQRFQPELFPSINYGMAYNPWAEAYSWLGNLGVFIYSISLLLILRFLWKFYLFSTRSFSIIILILGVTAAFWVHRNSLATLLAYNRNILYPLLVIYFFYKLLDILIPKKKRYE